MKHVTQELTAWVGGELSADETARVEAHLAECPSCRAEADTTRTLWAALEPAAVPATPRSVWPDVRERTTGNVGGWSLLAGHPYLRGSLAAATVACGVLLGVLAPGNDTAVAGDGADADLWLAGTSWLDGTSNEVGDVWLDVGLDPEVTP